MVTKQEGVGDMFLDCLILAKIHMVTKRVTADSDNSFGLILAKIHMVTKQETLATGKAVGLILAKIHMVTKPQIHNSIYLKTNKS